MIRCALLSRWHVHANDYARQAKQLDGITLTAVWDEQPDRGAEWAKELNIPFYADLEELLSSPDIDAVIVASPTNQHTEIITRCAEKGKHIFTEKILAFSVRECEAIYAAIEQAGVHFMISLPRLTDPVYLYAQAAMDRGELGTLQYIRCRLAHSGGLPYEGHPNGWLPAHFFSAEQCGGGALIDLGAHPIYLTNRLAGPAAGVSARFTYGLGHAVEDQAVVTVDYASGAIGVLEAGFSSAASPFLLELHGTTGSIMIEDGDLRIKSAATEQKWLQPELPQPIARPMEQWVKAIESGATPTITRMDTMRLTQINEAAALSHKEGRRIQL